MESVLSVAFPLFAMIFCGYIIIRREVVKAETVSGLIMVVFWLFLPAFILIKMLDADIESNLDFTFLAAYYTASATIFIPSIILSRRLFALTPRENVIRSLSSVAGVTGYMGLPLIVLVMGNDAILPAVTLVIVDKLFVVVGGTLMLEACARPQGENRVDWGLVSKQLAKAVVTSPLLLSVLVATILIVIGWQLPQPVRFFLEQFALATGPCALLAIGITLASKKVDSKSTGEIAQLVGIKSLLFPLLVFLSGRYLYDLPDIELMVLLVMAATPVATNVFILASKYRAYVTEVSSSMLYSTMMSVLVISGVLILMG